MIFADRVPATRGLLSVVAVLLFLVSPALAEKTCKKGKKPCGGRCISAKKDCPADSPPAAAPAGPKCKKGQKVCGDTCIPKKKVCAAPAAAPAAQSGPVAKAATEPTDELLQTPPGQVLLTLARALKKSGALDVEDRQREGLRQALRAQKPPIPICGAAQNQLVRACEKDVGGTLTLPCTLATEEIATFCKERTGAAMARFR